MSVSMLIMVALIGVLLVVVVMMVFAPGGVLGMIDRLKIAGRRRRSSSPPAGPPAVDPSTIPEGAAR